MYDPQHYTVSLHPGYIPLLERHGYPYVPDVDTLLTILMNHHKFKKEFFISFSFEPLLVQSAACLGFFPMAIVGPESAFIFAMKLHKERCVMKDLTCLHVSKSQRKVAGKFDVTINEAFQRSIEMCVEQHGENWLCPMLQKSFSFIHHNQDQFTMKLYSIELWHQGEIVACELGYSIGSIYTSLTGAYTMSSSGKIQLLTLGKLLHQNNFLLWDFGMAMDYKLALGATTIPTDEWITLTSTHTITTPSLTISPHTNCRSILSPQ